MKARLYAAFLLLAALGALHTGVAEWAGSRRYEAFHELQSAVARQRVLVQVHAALTEQQKRIGVAEVLEMDDVTVSDELRRGLIDVGDRLLASLDSMAVGDPAHLALRGRVAELLRAWDAYYRDRGVDPTLALVGLVRTAEPLASALLHDELTAAIQREESAVVHAGQSFVAADAAASRLVWMILGLSITLGVGLAFVLARHLLLRLAALRMGAERLRAGELDHRIALDGRDELAGVATSFNQMAASLQMARHKLEHSNGELAHAVQRLEESKAELVQAEKLKAMGGMLAGLAHELNNPLASVLGYGELIQSALEGDDAHDRAKLHELIAPLVDEALRAREMVRNMLQFSRKSASTLVAVNVADAMNVAVALRQYAFTQAGLSLDVCLPSDLWVTAEPQKLQQVFLNLINNAYHALSSGNGTGLSIRCMQVDSEVAEIQFLDDGPGFAEPDRVFDPFYTTKPTGEGTGLGLTLVHRFQEEFGGWVSVQNAPAGGALITLRYGLSEKTCLAAPAAGSDPIEPPPGLHRVLVVEDEAPLRLVQKRMLSRLNIQVVEAATGAAARDILLHESVDAVISDIRMPGEMDGADLFAWVCEYRPELRPRFVFVTGAVHDEELAGMVLEEPHRFIMKPFQMDEYLRRVAALLDLPTETVPHVTAGAAAVKCAGA